MSDLIEDCKRRFPLTSREPFDPSPTDSTECAHLHMSLAAKHLRLAVGHLEAVDPVLQRQILTVLENAVQIRNSMAPAR